MQPITHRTNIVRANGRLTAKPEADADDHQREPLHVGERNADQPDGTGRFRLTGCERSDGASSTSLIT